MLVGSLWVSRGLCPFLGQGTSDRLRCGLTERYLSRHTEDAFCSGAKRSLLRLPLELSPSPETAEEPVPTVHLWHARPKSGTRGALTPCHRPLHASVPTSSHLEFCTFRAQTPILSSR
jgi:hypothetical protein